MFRHLRLLVLLLLVALGLVAGHAPQARAETEDIVRHLDATYQVQRDGTVDVSYRLDWDFGRKGAHGIKLGIVTTERWEDDPLKEALYQISDLTVSSPTGVPTDVDSYETSDSLELQIGDPSTELDVKRATYVVTYTIGGAMRTFDGNPQFYWDVTSSDFPAVENFTITVTGPSDIPRARCLQSYGECTAKTTGNQAVLTGSDVESAETITAVAEFAPGSVQNAEPNLRDRELYSPALLRLKETVTIGTDGVAHFQQRLRVKTTPESSEVSWEIPERRSLTWSKDQLFEVSDVSVTLDGNPLPVSRETESEGEASQRAEFEAELPEGSHRSETVDLVAAYQVRGTVVSDGTGPASYVWPISTFESREYDLSTTESVSWKLPAAVSRIDCRYSSDLDETDGRCSLDDHLSSDGDTATFTGADEDGSAPGQWVIIEFPPDSVGQLLPVTDRSQTAGGLIIAGLVVGALLIFPLLGWQLSRIRIGAARDQRYADAPPGNIGSNKNVTTARLHGPVPVRFHPPEASLIQVGLALDRKINKRHLAATLINMAATGAVRLQSKPLSMWQLDSDLLTSSFERSLYERGKPDESNGELTEADKRAMGRQLEGQYKQAKQQQDLLRPFSLRGPTAIVWATPPALTVGAGATAAMITGWGGWLPISVGIAVLITVGVLAGAVRRPNARTAKATAYAEQAIGFREYLRAAESSELNVDADADIYRRYLPWAVLFDEVDRWTKACQQLAATGRIDAPDTSFVLGLGSVDSLSRDLRSFTSSVSSSPSSSAGGSGGSSGFSGGAGGGGGGGGTSASSW